MLDRITINQDFKPENPRTAKCEGVIVNSICSQAFSFGDNMGNFKRTKPPLCKCGCGEPVKWNQDKKQWNKYIYCHHCKGRKIIFTDEHCEKISISQKKSSFFHIYNKTNAHSKNVSRNNRERKLSKETRKKISKSIKALGENHPFRSEEYKKNQSKRMSNMGNNHPSKTSKFRKEASKRMKNGGASHASSFIKTPSKPQVELFNKIKKIFPQAQLNYPSLNRSIDVAIPDRMIAIEYDGSYWHQDEEADQARQKELEKIGWKFLRYCDCVPSMKELRKKLHMRATI